MSIYLATTSQLSWLLVLYSWTDIVLGPLVDCLVFCVVPLYIEGIGIAIVLASVMRLSAWDGIIDLVRRTREERVTTYCTLEPV